MMDVHARFLLASYSVTGVDNALLRTEALNVLMNLHNSFFAIVLTIAAGAHPPGFTIN